MLAAATGILMNATNIGTAPWGASYRMIAAEKWRRKSAHMGRPATEALVKFLIFDFLRAFERS